MDNTFTGFGSDAVSFFEGLQADNSKSYFDPRKAIWTDQVKAPMQALLDELTADLGGTTKIYRLNRDVRFSKDKSPYKTSTYGTVTGRSDGFMELFAAISARGFYTGTGFYPFAKNQLTAFRETLDDHVAAREFTECFAPLQDAGFDFDIDALKTAPRGVAKDHPQILFMRWKSVVMGKRIPPAAALSGRAPIEHAKSVWAELAPMREWFEAYLPPAQE